MANGSGPIALPFRGTEKVEIKTATLKIGHKGTLRVVIDTTQDVEVLYGDSVKVQRKDGIVEVEVPTPKDAVIKVPCDIKKLSVESSGKDVEVSYSTEFFEGLVDVSTVNGDVKVEGTLTGNLEVSAVSGDVILEVKPILNLGKCPDVSISTVSGNVIISSFVPGNFKVSTLSGDVNIVRVDTLFSDSLYRYRIKTVFGDVEAPKEVKSLVSSITISFKSDKSEKRREREMVKRLLGQDFGDVAYNRVLGLNLPAIVWGNMDWGNYFLGLSYGTASNKFYYNVDLEKYLITEPVRFGVGVSLYNKVLSPDPWKVSTGENSWHALLLKDDLLDYYRAKGGSAYITLREGPMTLKLSLVEEERYSEKVNTDYSRFNQHKNIRPNPTIDEGLAQVVRVDLMVGPMNLCAEYYLRSPMSGGSKIYRLYGDITANSKFKLFHLYHQVDFGYTNGNSFPYTFTLGGPTTLPGYSVNSIETQKFIIANEYLVFPTKFVDFLVGGYAGHAENKFYADFVAGLNIFNGLSVFLTRDREANGHLKYFLRFETRIW